MQTTLKLTALAGAVALALGAGQASAKVETSTFGSYAQTGGELLLQVWDVATETGYTRDLGINFKNMATPEAVSAMAANTTILSYTADANWATFLGGVNDLANLQWGLVVGESFSPASVYTTTPVGQDVLVPGANIASTVANGYDVYLAQLNARSEQAVAGDFSSITHVGEDGYWPQFSDDWLPIEETAFGESLAFWRIAYSGDASTGNIATQFLGLGGAPALWSLANDGTLTFAAVPEAETWALLGLGLLGSRRRRGAPAQPLALA